jgi:tetratricopeptide (TPR) repeat protein
MPTTAHPPANADLSQPSNPDVLKTLRADLSQQPHDIATLAKLVEGSIERRAARVLTSGTETVIRQVDGPLAVRPVAEGMATAIDNVAGRSSLRFALELQLRRSRLLQACASDPAGAAAALEAAWRACPDERVATAAQLLLPPRESAWEAPLEALAQVADGPKRREALKSLAANALERRHLMRARRFFEALPSDDGDARQGLASIVRLEEAGAHEIVRYEADLKAAATAQERARAWAGLARVRRSLGDFDEARRAFRMAIQSGDADAIVALDALFREHGRDADRRAEFEDLLRDAPPTLHHALRRRLFELAREVGAPAGEAASVIGKARPRSDEAARRALDEAATLERRQQPAEAAARLEDAASLTQDAGARLDALERGARLFERAGRHGDAERLWRKVRAIDPRSKAALDFYRGHYESEGDDRRLYATLLQLHAIAGDPADRRSLAETMVAIAESQLKDAERAIEALRLVEKDLGSGADPRPVWRRLRDHCATAGRWHAWVELVEREIAFLPETHVAEKVELLFTMVEVFQDPERLPMPAMVQATYQRIVALEPQQPVALEKLCSSLEEREQWEDLRNVLSAKVEFAEPSEIIPLFQKIAELYLDHIKSDSQAIAVLEQLLELDPGDVAVMHRLRELYRKRHAAPELYENLAYELGFESEPQHRLALLAEQAALAEHRMLKPDLAIERWKEVLAIDPRHAEALAALARLHAEQQDWEAWVAVQERRIAETSNKAARLPLLFDLGEVLYLRVGDHARADATFRTIAASASTSATARRFLQRIFVQHRKWDELQRLFGDATTGALQSKDLKSYVQVLEDAVKAADNDAVLATDVLVELARLHETHGDAERALACRMRAIAHAPDRLDIAEAALGMLDAGAEPERRSEVLRTIGNHAVLPDERLAAWLEAAEIARSARRHDEAFEASRRAVVIAAELAELGALDGFERDAEASSRWEEAWQALDEALPRIPTDALLVRTAYHRSLGRIAGARLMMADEAVRHFRWVLQLLPGDGAALEELEKIYFSRNDFRGLEEVYRMRADTAPAGSEPRLKALRAMASLHEDVLADNDKAASCFFELALDGDTSDETVTGLTRTMEARGAWADLAGALETVILNIGTGTQRMRLHLQLFRIYAEHLDERVAAVDHARSLCEMGEAPPVAVVEHLEKWLNEPVLAREVAPVLETAYRRLDRPDKLVAVLELRRNDASGDALVGILDDLAMLHETMGNSAVRAFAALRERFEIAPLDVTTWDAQARLAEELDRAEELASLWESGLTRAGDWPRGTRGQLHWRLAEVYHRQLIEIDQAIEHTVKALETIDDPRERQLLHDLLETLHRKNADPEAFVATKLRAAEEALSRNVRRTKLIDAARTLAGAMRKPEDALALMMRIFDEDPGERESGEVLFELLEKSGLHDLLDEARRRAMGATTDTGWRDEIAFQRAIFLRDARGEWENAIFELLRLIDSEVSGLNARMALLDIARAEESRDQRDVILEDLRVWFTEHEDDEGLIQALLVEGEFAPPGRARADIHAQAAELAARRFIAGGRAELVLHALQLYGHALMDMPDSLELLQTAERLAEQAEALTEWSEILEECLASLPAGTPTPNLHVAVGTVRLALGQADAAMAAFERAIDEAPRDSVAMRQALRQLAELEAAREANDVALRHLEQFLQNAPEAQEALDAELRIADLAAFTEHSDLAIDALRRALSLVRGDATAFADGPERVRGLRERLDALLEEVGRDEDRVEMLLDQADEAEDPDETLLLLQKVADILRGDDGGDAPDVSPSLAIGAWERLNGALSGDDGALSELARLYGESGHWLEVAGALEQRADLAADRGELAMARSLTLERVRILLDQLDAGEDAVEALRLVLEDDPGDDEALLLLEGLLMRPELTETVEPLLVDCLRRKGHAGKLAAALEARVQAGRATMADILELVPLLRHDPRRAWGVAARGYALAPTTPDGARCRELAIDLTSEHQPQAPAAGALAAMLAAVARELPTAVERAEAAERDLLQLKQRNLLDDDTAAPLQRVLLLAKPDRQDVAIALEQWARRHDRREVLAEILAARAMTLDGDRRAQIELERARLLARLPRQEQAAIAAYTEAIVARPDLHEAHRERLAMLRRADRHGDELEALRAWVEVNPPADERSDVTRRLFELAAPTHPEEALALAERELATQPGNPFWVDALERLLANASTARGAYRALETHFAKLGDTERLHAHYRQLPDLGDPAFDAEVLQRRYKFEQLLPNGADDAFRTMLLLLAVTDEPLVVIAELRHAADTPGRRRELAQGLVGRLKARPNHGVLVALAEVMSARVVDDPQAAQGARAAWEQALAGARTDLTLRRGYEQLLRQLNDAAALEKSLAEHVRLLEPSTARVRLELERAAQLGGKLQRHEDAARIIERIARDATDSALRNEVREAEFLLLRHRGAWNELTEAQERWLEATEDPNERAAIQIGVASACLTPDSPRVGDGVSLLETVLNAHPGHADATAVLLRFVRENQSAAETSTALARDLADAADLIERHHADARRPDVRALVLSTRLRLASGAEEQRGLLVELARAEAGERPIVALAHFRAALVLDPHDDHVADELEALVRERRLFVEGAEALCDVAERAGVPTYYRRAAPIFAHELREPARAADCWERYLGSAGADGQALRELIQLYAILGEARSEAAALEKHLDGTAQGDEAARLRVRLGDLRAEALNDPDGAVAAYEGALEATVADPEAFARLERLYLRANRNSDLVFLYRTATHADVTTAVKIRTLSKQAQVLETRLDDAPSAVEALHAILKLDPGNRFAFTSLERIEQSRGNWEEVDALLARQLALAESGDMRLKLLLQRATNAMEGMGEPASALTSLVEADALEPQGPGADEFVTRLEGLLSAEPEVRARAAEMLARRYRARQNWFGLVNVLLVATGAIADAGARERAAEETIAVIAERFTSNDDGARRLGLLLALLRQAPGSFAVRDAIDVELARDPGALERVVTFAWTMLKRTQEGREQAEADIATWLSGLENRAGRPEGAVRALERALSSDPLHVHAFRALCRHYRDAGARDRLAGVHAERQTLAPAAEKAALRVEEALDLATLDGDGGTRLWAALEGTAGDARVDATLIARCHDAVAGAMAREAARRRWPAGAPRKTVLKRLLESLTDARGDVAIAARWELLGCAVAFEHTEIARESALTLLAHGRVDARLPPLMDEVAFDAPSASAFAAALDQAVERFGNRWSLEVKRIVQLLRARILARDPARFDEAVRVLRDAVAADPEFSEGRRTLVSLHGARGDFDAYIDAAQEFADLGGDALATRDLWLDLKRLAEARGDNDTAILACQSMLAIDANDDAAATALAELLRNTGRLDELATLLEARLDSVDDPKRAALILLEIGQIRLDVGGDQDGAVDAWREAWAMAPELEAPTRKLEAMARERGDLREVGELLAGHAAALGESKACAAAWREAGEAFLAARAWDDARTAAESAIAAHAEDIGAHDLLVRVLGIQSNFRALAAALEARARSHREAAERAKGFVQAAAVHADRLGDAATAENLLALALTLKPTLAEGHLLRSRLAKAAGHLDKAATALEAALEDLPERRRARALFDLARLHAERGDEVRCLRSLLESLAIEPTAADVETYYLERLEAGGRHDDIVAWLSDRLARRTGEKAPPENAEPLAALALRLVNLVASRNPSDPRLNRWFENARSDASFDQTVVAMQEAEIAIARQDWTAAVALFARAIGPLEQRKATDQLMRCWFRTGFAEEKLGHLAKALAAYGRAHELNGRDVPNLLSYGRVLVEARKWQTAVVVNQSLLVVKDALSSEDQGWVLARLALACHGAGDTNRARNYSERLQKSHPDHPGVALVQAELAAT